MAETPLEMYTMPPLWGTPSPSPFAIKLETWLRMAEIPYVRHALASAPRSATGKIPYVVMPDGRMLHDSGLIVATLSRERGISLDSGLDARELAVGHAVRRMLEEHLYFIGLCDRWLSDEGYACTSRDYFRYMPAPVRWILPGILRRRIRSYAYGQGMGRHPPEVRAELARADLAALAEILGDQDHILGRLSTVDATATGFLWGFSANPFPSVVGDALKAHPSLLAYVQKMRARYWPEDFPT